MWCFQKSHIQYIMRLLNVDECILVCPNLNHWLHSQRSKHHCKSYSRAALYQSSWSNTEVSAVSHSPRRTRRTGCPRSVARSGPPPRPRGWCTSPAGRCGCGAPSCAAPPGWRSCRGRPCRSSPRAPVPAFPAPPWCRGPSGPGTGACCCSATSGRTPAFLLRRSGLHDLVWDGSLSTYNSSTPKANLVMFGFI